LSKTYRQAYGKRIHSALTVLAGEMAPTICTHQRLAPQADNLHHEMLPMFLPIETSTPDDPDEHDPGDPEQAPVVG
jgi:hypothetical protein